MGRNTIPGLRNRNGIWHIEKQILGQKICESTGTSDRKEAELILARRIDEVRQAVIFGVRPKRTFREAATKFLEENLHLARIGDYASHLKMLDPFIGDLTLEKVHLGTLQPFIEARRKQGVKTATINHGLAAVRRILNLAARLWRDEHGLTWLETAPLIQLLPVTDARQPYPLSWDEQTLLFQELPDHLARMCLFKINTGCREQEVCQLRWEWEIPVPELETSVFLIPGGRVKNREDRLVVLNRIAHSVIEQERGRDPEFVFSYRGHSVGDINTKAWQRARVRAALQMVGKDPDCDDLQSQVERIGQGIVAEVSCIQRETGRRLVTTYTLDDHDADRIARGCASLRWYQRKDPDLLQTIHFKAMRLFIERYWPVYARLANVRVHDMKHTWGRRLRAAGVPLETRKVLLGHRNGDITSHYSAPELEELIAAANRVCERKSGKSPALVLLKQKTATGRYR